jgi:uncharacterized protein
MVMTDLFTALVIGTAFGFVLERAGLGDANRLAGQFYLRDFTVFKVMMTAIVTAMLGLFWLGWLEVVPLATLHVPETFLLPQAMGGLVFGAGFVLSGLCPGTSCVAAASGRIDGLAVVVGLFAGVVAAGLAFPLYAGFYNATPMGVLTLPRLTGLPYGVIVAAVTAVALLAFAAIGRFARSK